jgi:hypothetical protein
MLYKDNPMIVAFPVLKSIGSTYQGIIIPSTVNEYQSLTANVGELRKVTRLAHSSETYPLIAASKRLLGNYTAIRCVGGWYDSEQEKTIEENTVFVYTVSEVLPADAPLIVGLVELAQQIKAELGQDAVLIYLNGEAYLV